MEDRIFCDTDTIRDLVQIAKVPDHAKSDAMTALVRRGLPARLFGGTIQDGSPVFDGHVGFSCKGVEAAMKRLGFRDDEMTALIKNGHVIGVMDGVAAAPVGVGMASLKPKLADLAKAITALLAFAAKEAATDIARGNPMADVPGAKTASHLLQLPAGKLVRLAD